MARAYLAGRTGDTPVTRGNDRMRRPRWLVQRCCDRGEDDKVKANQASLKSEKSKVPVILTALLLIFVKITIFSEWKI
jgi:hypothetical protein